jgi:hypothetical protein
LNYQHISRRDNRPSWSGVCHDHVIPVGGCYTYAHSRKDKNEYEEWQRGIFHGRFLQLNLFAVRQDYQESRTFCTFCELKEIPIVKDCRLPFLQLGAVEE